MADSYWIEKINTCSPENLSDLLRAWLNDLEEDEEERFDRDWLDHYCCEPTMRRVR